MKRGKMARKFLFTLMFFVLVLVSMGYFVDAGVGILSITPSPSISPNQSYEFKNESFELTVNNSGNDPICNILLYVYDYGGGESPNKANYTINLVIQKNGWVYSFDETHINWTTTTNCINQSKSEKFYFYASAHEVSSDALDNWDIAYNNYLGFTQDLWVTILNDSLAPNLTNVIPPDWSFIRGNSINFTFIFRENESGLNQSATGIWFFEGGSYIDACQGASNWSSIGLNVCQENSGIYNCSWSIIKTGPYFDYTIESKDLAGNNFNESYCSSPDQKKPTHHLYIDTEKPKINLIDPENGSNLSGIVPFNFSAYDNSFETAGVGNFAPTINCSLIINGEIKNSTGIINVLSNSLQNLSLTYNVSSLQDGNYLWYINCIDAAGWENQSENRWFMVDSHPPNITLISPENGSYTQTNVTFEWNAKDISEPINCSLYINNTNKGNKTGSSGEFNLTIYGLSPGLHSWYVACSDATGKTNTSQTWQFIVDNKNPVVTIIKPKQNDSSNGSYSGTNSVTITFNFTAYDDKTNLSCEWFINGNKEGEANITNGTYYNFTKTFTQGGSYTWQVNCNDKAGNIGKDNASFEVNVQSSSGGGGGAGGGSGAGCYNECSYGTKINVNGTHYKVCGNYDTDSCYEWKTFACANGTLFMNGVCQTLKQSCKELWKCDEWEPCIEGIQTRNCVDVNNCGTEKNKPITQQSCVEKVNATQTNVSKTNQGFNFVGAAIGTLKRTWLPALIALLLILGSYFVIKAIRKRKEEEEREVKEKVRKILIEKENLNT